MATATPPANSPNASSASPPNTSCASRSAPPPGKPRRTTPVGRGRRAFAKFADLL
jgi:hypothetical protein